MTSRTRTGRRAALVTGATSGIGEAFAQALPRETGLLLTGRNREALRALAAELSSPGRPVDGRRGPRRRRGAGRALGEGGGLRHQR